MDFEMAFHSGTSAPLSNTSASVQQLEPEVLLARLVVLAKNAKCLHRRSWRTRPPTESKQAPSSPSSAGRKAVPQGEPPVRAAVASNTGPTQHSDPNVASDS